MACGRRFLQNLFRDAKVINLTFVVIISCFFVFIYKKNRELQFYDTCIAMLEKKTAILQERKEKQNTALEQVRHSNNKYLSEKVESTFLLSAQLPRIQALYRNYPTNTVLQERLFFLQGDGNRLKFIPAQTREGFSFRETEFTLQTPVQMDEKDLKNILSDLEGFKQNKPIIIIKKFKLLKNSSEGGDCVYNIYIELIQRSL
jgi:hypothetical protein